MKNLRKDGINCSGLINLICCHLKIQIPTEYPFPGGTDAWYKYFKEKKLLNSFNINSNYPSGTLLLTPYKNVNQQGHIAIVYDDHVIQSYADQNYNKTKKLYLPGVNKSQTLMEAHKYFKFEFYVKPENWLIKKI